MPYLLHTPTNKKHLFTAEKANEVLNDENRAGLWKRCDDESFEFDTERNEYVTDRRALITRHVGGIGDYVILIPAIKAKILKGYKIDLCIPQKFHALFSHLDVKLYDHDAEMKKEDYREVYHFADIFTLYEEETGGQPDLDRFEISHKYLKVSDYLQDSYSAADFGFATPGRSEIREIPFVGVALRTTSPLRNWPFFREIVSEGYRFHAFDAVRSSPGMVSENCRSIVELINRVADMDLIVSGDTGILHLALALGVPTISIFGPTDPKFVISRYDTDKISFYGEWANCSAPCYNQKSRGFQASVCKPQIIPVCMKSVQPETVKRAIDAFFQRRVTNGKNSFKSDRKVPIPIS